MGAQGSSLPATWVCSEPPATWAEAVAAKPGEGLTVVESTRYGGGKGVFFDASVKFEEALTALGCKAYNPNTRLKKEGYTDAEANDQWLDRFTAEVEAAHDSKGFVLQIQQGRARGKSHMQIGEERIAKWSKQPVLGVYITDRQVEQNGEYPLFNARIEAWCAIDLAKRQWANGVRDTVESVEAHPTMQQFQDYNTTIQLMVRPQFELWRPPN